MQVPLLTPQLLPPTRTLPARHLPGLTCATAKHTSHMAARTHSHNCSAQSDNLPAASAEQTEAETDAARKSAEAAESLSRAVMELARAAAATVEAGEVVLKSANLNLTTEARPPGELAARPVQCDTASERPATVQMDPSILMAAEGANASLPISVVLYAVPGNLRSNAMGRAASANDTVARRQRMRRLEAAAGGDGELIASSSPSDSSPTVSFSLLQSGAELRVKRAAQPINVSV